MPEICGDSDVCVGATRAPPIAFHTELISAAAAIPDDNSNSEAERSYSLAEDGDLESQHSHTVSLMHEVRKRARSLSSDLSAPCCLSKPLLTQSPLVAAQAATAAACFSTSQESVQREAKRPISLCAVMLSATMTGLLVVCAIFALELQAGQLEKSFLEGVPELHADSGMGAAVGVATQVLQHLGATELSVGNQPNLAFQVGGDTGLQPCDPSTTLGCVQVSRMMAKLENQVNPSLVLVLANTIEVEAYARASGSLRRTRLGVLAGLFVLSLLIFWAVHGLVLRPLARLSYAVGYLGDLNCGPHGELKALRRGCRSRVREVSALEGALDQVGLALETFGRFIPVAVVRDIVHGDEKSMRLHVSPRDVTIMFTDIKDFTTLCEQLPQRDLLFIVTRYLSVMTRIVEMYDGIVAEVLGDGLLVFWNTPVEVADHAAKACSASLSMQHALALLNSQFQGMGLPQLSIRIGLHTGPVLSGILGSEMRMKFGCMGDSVNLASRLEGLCKFYGVSIICSASTFEALPPEYRFVLRKLDLVQVKGKDVSTSIYELLGIQRNNDLPGRQGVAQLEPARSGSTVQSQVSSNAADESPATSSQTDGGGVDESRLLCAEWYEKALAAYQRGDFLVARDLSLGLLQVHPDDVAARRLFERANRYISPDGVGVVGLTNTELERWTGVMVMDK